MLVNVRLVQDILRKISSPIVGQMLMIIYWLWLLQNIQIQIMQQVSPVTVTMYLIVFKRILEQEISNFFRKSLNQKLDIIGY